VRPQTPQLANKNHKQRHRLKKTAARHLLSLTLFTTSLSTRADRPAAEPMFLARMRLRQALWLSPSSTGTAGPGQDRFPGHRPLTNSSGGAAVRVTPCRSGLADGVLPAKLRQQRGECS